MNSTNAKRLAVALTIAATTASGAAYAASSASATNVKPATTHTTHQSRDWTPNDCIRQNGGDFNACNVGNSGRGDLPYQTLNGT
jgi:roadblock/LC7 domain-containing protein